MTPTNRNQQTFVVFALAVLCGLVAAMLIWLLLAFLGISDSDLSAKATQDITDGPAVLTHYQRAMRHRCLNSVRLSKAYDRSSAVRYVLVVLTALPVIACDESFTGPAVPLNREFVLAPAEQAIVEGAALSVRFNQVTGDSRCPADAVCILGGDAIVDITVTSAGGTQNYELHTGDLRPVRHGNLTIALVQLAPYPFSARPIQPDEYRATLKVIR